MKASDLFVQYYLFKMKRSINAVLGNAIGSEEDTLEGHAFDTVKGSDYLADQDAVEILCKEAPNTELGLELIRIANDRLFGSGSTTIQN